MTDTSPLPPRRGRENPGHISFVIDRLAMLEPGKSILVDADASFTSYGIYAKRLGIKIKRKKQGDKYRFWRVQ